MNLNSHDTYRWLISPKKNTEISAFIITSLKILAKCLLAPAMWYIYAFIWPDFGYKMLRLSLNICGWGILIVLFLMALFKEFRYLINSSDVLKKVAIPYPFLVWLMLGYDHPRNLDLLSGGFEPTYWNATIALASLFIETITFGILDLLGFNLEIYSPKTMFATFLFLICKISLGVGVLSVYRQLWRFTGSYTFTGKASMLAEHFESRSESIDKTTTKIQMIAALVPFTRFKEISWDKVQELGKNDDVLKKNDLSVLEARSRKTSELLSDIESMQSKIKELRRTAKEFDILSSTPEDEKDAFMKQTKDALAEAETHLRLLRDIAKIKEIL